MDKQPVVLVLGSAPQHKQQTLEVFLEQEHADRYILQGLFGAFQNHLDALEPGGQISLIVTRALEDVEDSGVRDSSGSFVINNVKGDRHVWDFHTMRAEAKPVAD